MTKASLCKSGHKVINSFSSGKYLTCLDVKIKIILPKNTLRMNKITSFSKSIPMFAYSQNNRKHIKYNNFSTTNLEYIYVEHYYKSFIAWNLELIT